MALDLEKYRKRLIEERDKLSQDIGTVGEVADPAPDDRQITAADAPLISEVVDVQNTIIDMKSDRLERINAALQSIDDGTYGACTECGKQIDPRRLDADPAAMTCIDDASKESSIATPSM
ncbi:MAG TPA: molecular chaperone DnaK [Blastocatellia bacterium]|jgi:RNA polymerase-binding transcription factor DksA